MEKGGLRTDTGPQHSGGHTDVLPTGWFLQSMLYRLSFDLRRGQPSMRKVRIENS